jgi:DNA-binding NarL/FixJ family response regulator
MRPACLGAVTSGGRSALHGWMLAPPERRPIRVLVVDDHDVVRAGIAGLLDAVPDIEVVGTAADGLEAVELAADCDPDVVLMDLVMPYVDGIEATRRITDARTAGAVLVLTSFSDHIRVTAALDSGAIGYLLKDAEPEELVAGIRAAADGDSPLAPRVARRFVRERRAMHPDEELTEREREILALVAAGVPNKQIALRLGITAKTVKSHLTHVFRRIGVHDRLEAARWAERHGLAAPTRSRTS